MRNIQFSKNVEFIGTETFRNCTSLEEIYFEDDSLCSVIGNSAFRDCSSLMKIDLPESLTEIKSNVFQNCPMIYVCIEKQVQKIGAFAFQDCTNLMTIEFEEGSEIVTIGGCAFRNTNISTITIPSTVTKISSGAFMETNITSVVIPASVRRVGRLAFGDKLETLYFENFSGWNLVVENTAGNKYVEIEYNITVTNNSTNITNYNRVGTQPSSDSVPNYYYFEKDLDMELE